MNNFERAINKWRTTTNKIFFNEVGASLINDEGTVTVFSNVKYSGIPCSISADSLKDLKAVNGLTEICFDGDGLSWIGDITVTVPAEEDHIISVTPYHGIPVNWEALEYVLRSTSTDEKRLVLNTVCFEPNRIVSTDGFRIHWRDGDYGGIKSGNKYPTLIYNKTLLRIKNDFEITHFDDHSIITYLSYGHQVSVKTNWIVGIFPDYRSVIPDKTKVDFTMPWDNRFKKINKNIMEITIGDKTKINCFDDANRSVRVELELDLSLDEPVELAVNPEYLFDAMNGKDAVIGFNDDDTPILINDNAVVMPMNLS